MNNSLESNLSTVQKVLILTAAIIFIIEFLIMKVLPLFSIEFSVLSEAVIDATLLTVLSTPFIYFFVVRPFKKEYEDIAKKISHMENHDSLTGLANRNLFKEYIDKELKYKIAPDNKCAILLVNLEKFQSINESYTHLAGDFVLIEIAKRLHVVAKNSDIISRTDGNEFAIIIRNLDKNQNIAEEKAISFAKNILDEISRPFVYEHQTLHVEAYIAIRICNSVQIKFESLFNEVSSTIKSARKIQERISVYKYGNKISL